MSPDADPGGPKTYGSYGSGSGFGSATLLQSIISYLHPDQAYRIMLTRIRLFALTRIRIWLFVRIRNPDLYHSDENLQTGLQTLQGSILSPPSG